MAEQWLTYQQAGDLIGISAEAVRRHAARYGWRRQRGNDGKALVLMGEREAGQVRTRPGGQQVERPAGQPSGRSGGQPGEIAALAEVLSELRRRAETAEARAGSADARADAAETRARHLAAELAVQHERAGRAEGERDAIRTEVVVLRGDALAERERANAALERAAEAEARLAAGSPVARAAKAWQAFRSQWRRP